MEADGSLGFIGLEGFSKLGRCWISNSGFLDVWKILERGTHYQNETSNTLGPTCIGFLHVASMDLAEKSKVGSRVESVEEDAGLELGSHSWTSGLSGYVPGEIMKVFFF